MRIFVLAATLLIGGCVSTQTTYLANGQRVVRIACSLATDTLTPCYKTAGSICGSRGYIIYDWNGQPWPTPYPVPESIAYAGTLQETELLIACRS